jgi:hypothetical protein
MERGECPHWRQGSWLVSDTTTKINRERIKREKKQM